MYIVNIFTSDKSLMGLANQGYWAAPKWSGPSSNDHVSVSLTFLTKKAVSQDGVDWYIMYLPLPMTKTTKFVGLKQSTNQWEKTCMVWASIMLPGKCTLHMK